MSRSAESYLRLVRIPIVVVMLGLLVAGCGVNNIPTYEESAKAKWSEVLNQYQRRADLIPNLVETVKGYAAHERQVLEEVTDARARATPDATRSGRRRHQPGGLQALPGGAGALSGALSRLLAVSERYPDLKANQNFLALQSQLEGTENRIAVARRDYIEAVRTLQHRAAHVSGRDLGVNALSQRQADGDLHGGGRGEETADREILTHA